MKRILAVLACAFFALFVSSIAGAQNATETAVPDETAEPTPTLDPDDIAMQLPGLPPLPDPSTLEAADVRRPHTPRSADGGGRDVLPALARDEDQRALPRNGAETQTYGRTGLVLVGAGLALVVLAWKVRRRPIVAAEPAAPPPPPDDDDAPPWGTDSLIGW